MKHARNILWVILVLLTVTFFTACKEENATVKKNTNPEKVPTMVSHDVQTIISDSGRTRYSITTKLWNIYSESKVPHWTFPNGLVADELDEKFHQVASLICDSAHYDMNRRYWSAIGNVRYTMRNGDKIVCDRMYYDENKSQVNCMDNVTITRTNGDKILTNQMFYESREGRTHGDCFIHIEGSGRVIEGTGYEYFDKDQHYSVREVQGIFPINEGSFFSKKH